VKRHRHRDPVKIHNFSHFFLGLLSTPLQAARTEIAKQTTNGDNLVSIFDSTCRFALWALAKQAHLSCAGATKESIDDLLQMSINSPFLAATLGLGTQTGSSPTLKREERESLAFAKVQSNNDDVKDA
jgi:hypothetical protein